VVWDLDETLWHGSLIDNEPTLALREHVIEIIRLLDQKGILHSIASRNEHDIAMRVLARFEISDYFVYPQIGWAAKSASIKRISELLNISVDGIAFVDDDSFERDEVRAVFPSLLVIDSRDVNQIAFMEEMNPAVVTDDARFRRQMYQAEILRNQVEREFVGPAEAFLESLGMTLRISKVREGDLLRAEELTVRTTQLNSVGVAYTLAELEAFVHSDKYLLLIAELSDRYGGYGRVGLVLVECLRDIWTIKLFAMSCRVMSRGVGTVLLTYLSNIANGNKVRLLADYAPNERNRPMYMTYKFFGFKEVGRSERGLLLEHDVKQLGSYPKYVHVVLDHS
jgi:FkbH-like protein